MLLSLAVAPAWAAAPSTAPASQPARQSVPRRPVLSDDESQQLAAQLREAYLKPAEHWPAAQIDDPARPTFKDLGPLPKVEFPADNSYSKDKAELGKQLFFDPRLSA